MAFRHVGEPQKPHLMPIDAIVPAFKFPLEITVYEKDETFGRRGIKRGAEQTQNAEEGARA